MCREGKTLGKTAEIVSRRQFRPPVGGSKPCDQGLAGRPSGGKHGFEQWVIDLIDVLEKTAMLGLENRYLSL